MVDIVILDQNHILDLVQDHNHILQDITVIVIVADMMMIMKIDIEKIHVLVQDQEVLHIFVIMAQNQQSVKINHLASQRHLRLLQLYQVYKKKIMILRILMRVI